MQKACYYASALSLVGLILLCVAWELALAPLRPGGSWLVLKVLPLLLPLRGVLKRDLYTMQWASMLVLLYLAEGVVRAMTETGMSALLGALEIALVCVFFFSTVFYLRPYKQAAKALARQAIRKAAE
ncbi:MAG TPA: DUF2069 domain-containing protein [Noviherbaspirillum sp.]